MFNLVNLFNLLAESHSKVRLDLLEYQRIHAKSNAVSDALKFNGEYSEPSPMLGVTFNETRKNISFLCAVNGEVELGETRPAGLPEKLRTRIHRNYTVVRDGVLNFKSLPVMLERGTHAALSAIGAVDVPYEANKVYEIGLEYVPLCGKPHDPKEIFRGILALNALKCRKKVLEHFSAGWANTDSTLRLKYGEDAAKWLAEHGVTDTGYSPKSEKSAGENEYHFAETVFQVKGLATMPSYNAYRKQADKGGRLNLYMRWMQDEENRYEAAKSGMTEDAFREEIDGAIRAVSKAVREHSADLAELRWSIDPSLLDPESEFDYEGDTYIGLASRKESVEMI